jgi:thiamine-phosphate pyrophosphorylase
VPAPSILYYITDRKAFPGGESRRRLHLLLKIAEAARVGVNYIQLREKDLLTHELELLARDAVQVVRENSRAMQPTRLLVNSRIDVALVSGADGVHLRSDDLTPQDVRDIWRLASAIDRPHPIIGISCHATEEVQRAAADAADFAVFAPIFEKRDAPGIPAAGLETLRRACQTAIPVLGLGGITLENAPACLEAGATGIAAIRLFQDNDLAAIVPRLRDL